MPEPEHPTHPEAVAAAARADVVLRANSDWAALGFSASETATWTAAGIPTDKAHWAAMCRDTTRRPDTSVHVTPARLRRPLNTQSTVTALDALAQGANIVRIQARMVGTTIDTRLPVPLVAVTAENHLSTLVQAKKLTSSLGKILNDGPHGVPQAAAVVAEAEALVRPLWQARLDLARQIASHRRGQTPGPLLSAYARAHGVLAVGPTLDRLCDGVVADVAAVEYAATFAALLARAATAGNYMFMTPDAVAETAAYRHSPAVAHPASTRPFDLAGFAYLAATTEEDERVPARVVAWTSDGEHLRAALVSRGQLGAALLRVRDNPRQVETWQSGQDDTLDGAVRHVRLLTEYATLPPQHSERRAPRTVGTVPRDDGQATADGQAVLVYRSAPIEQKATAGAAERRRPDHRWMVRGHWRRQWYPALNTHKVIWIDDHESGPGDVPLLHTERVRVLTA